MEPAAENSNEQDGLTVVVHRRIKPGLEPEFEESMRSFVKFALASPGHRSISILRPAFGDREYVVVDSFADSRSREQFKESSEYREWMKRLGELTEGDPQIQELSGLEGWFTLPNAPALARPPKYKMALVTYIGVLTVVISLSVTVGPTIRAWPFFINNAVFNGLVVLILTWIVMPILTRIFAGWLFLQRKV